MRFMWGLLLALELVNEKIGCVLHGVHDSTAFSYFRKRMKSYSFNRTDKFEMCEYFEYLVQKLHFCGSCFDSICVQYKQKLLSLHSIHFIKKFSRCFLSVSQRRYCCFHIITKPNRIGQWRYVLASTWCVGTVSCAAHCRNFHAKFECWRLNGNCWFPV